MDIEDTDLFISYALNVTLMRFIGNVLVPSNLDINIAVERGEDADDNSIEFALTKWRYFIENIMSKSIAFGHENETAMSIVLDDQGVNKTGNLFFLSPDEPSDEVLAALLQAKFNALGDMQLYASSVEITSDNLNGLSFTLMGDHGSLLPTTIEEYLGGDSFWEKPWWHRNDASSIDVLKPDDDAKTPAWAYSLDFLDRSGKAKEQSMPPRSSFKPTIINGGKTDSPTPPSD